MGNSVLVPQIVQTLLNLISSDVCSTVSLHIGFVMS